MIHRIVPSRLKRVKGSIAENDFLAANRKLTDIPGVEQFELLRQVSPKNDFDFCVSMVNRHNGVSVPTGVSGC